MHSTIFSFDSLPFPVPELRIINQKLNTAASKQPEDDTSIAPSTSELILLPNAASPGQNLIPPGHITTGW